MTADTQNVVEQLREHLKPGDILNFYPFPIRKFIDIFRYAHIRLVAKAIQREARSYFGKNAEIRHFHTEIYFDPDHILNVIFPRARWDTLQETTYFNFSVYRVKNTDFTREDANYMIQQLEERRPYTDAKGDRYEMKVIGDRYDLGDLLDFLVNDMLGSRNHIKFRPFDFSKSEKVCSVASAIVLESLRRKLKSEERQSFEPLFQKINEENFLKYSPNGEEIVGEYKKNPSIALDSIRPSFYANTPDFFAGELEKVMEVRDSKISFT